MTDIHAVILNWNGWRDTIECLKSLKAQEDVNIYCLVVDNHSTDDSCNKIQAQYPEIEVLKNPRNLGYPGGMNAGIQYLLNQGAKYILILNNDVIADHHMVKSLIDHLSLDAGVVAPAIYYVNSPDKLWSVGGNIHPLFLEMLPKMKKNLELPNQVLQRDFLTGCALLIKSEVFEKTGFFDEIFFPGYYEDLDFCLRVRQKRYQMLLVPEAKLWHKVSTSSGGEDSPRVYYLRARNIMRYFRKHMRFYHIPFVFGLRFFSVLKTTLRLLFRKKYPCIHAYYSGLFDGWKIPGRGNHNQYTHYYSVEK